MEFKNIYEDTKRAEEYAKLEFPGTYYLAYRDLSKIILKHVKGYKAIDFGCGTGRSTRFIKEIGFNTTGIDNSEKMTEHAKKNDPTGAYILIKDSNFEQFEKNHFDLILSVFTFDNIPGIKNRLNYLNNFRNLINQDGRVILLDSTPEIYYNEWSSFTTKDFPENKNAKSGEKVKIIMKDVNDNRPVDDIIWFNEDYLDLFYRSKLKLIKSYKPLGKEGEPYKWINEKDTAPWIIYVLKK
ncbi:MAG: class I SAM-dependent methyltransferase [Bacteroidales bacterium]|nr:class I SAM-dependent methyltransferase [Bacteroidales bacterium]